MKKTGLTSRSFTRNNELNRRRKRLGFGESFRSIPRNNEVNRRTSLGFGERFIINNPYDPAFNSLAWQQQQMLAAMEKQQQILKEQQILAVMEESKRPRLGFTTSNGLPSTSKYYTSSGLSASTPMFGGSLMQGMGQGNGFNFAPGIINAGLGDAFRMNDMRSSGIQRLAESSMMNGERGQEQDVRTAMARYSQGMLRNTWKNSENVRSGNISSLRDPIGSMGMNFSDFTKN